MIKNSIIALVFLLALPVISPISAHDNIDTALDDLRRTVSKVDAAKLEMTSYNPPNLKSSCWAIGGGFELFKGAMRAIESLYDLDMREIARNLWKETNSAFEMYKKIQQENCLDPYPLNLANLKSKNYVQELQIVRKRILDVIIHIKRYPPKKIRNRTNPSR